MARVLIKNVAEKNGLDLNKLYTLIYNTPSIKTFGSMDNQIEESAVPQVVELYSQKEKQEEERARQEAERRAQERVEASRKIVEKNQAIGGIMISSGFNFEGYHIVKYSGYISGDDAIQINRDGLFNNAGQNLTNALSLIRIQALKELKEAAYDLGCNAVIGVDFDYITFEPQTANITGGTTYQPYVVCVTANGNAVVIEKDN